MVRSLRRLRFCQETWQKEKVSATRRTNVLREGNKMYVMVCKCCSSPVRLDEKTGAYFHVNGYPQLETIAREVTKVRIKKTKTTVVAVVTGMLLLIGGCSAYAGHAPSPVPGVSPAPLSAQR